MYQYTHDGDSNKQSRRYEWIFKQTGAATVTAEEWAQLGRQETTRIRQHCYERRSQVVRLVFSDHDRSEMSS